MEVSKLVLKSERSVKVSGFEYTQFSIQAGRPTNSPFSKSVFKSTAQIKCRKIRGLQWTAQLKTSLHTRFKRVSIFAICKCEGICSSGVKNTWINLSKIAWSFLKSSKWRRGKFETIKTWQYGEIVPNFASNFCSFVKISLPKILFKTSTCFEDKSTKSLTMKSFVLSNWFFAVNWFWVRLNSCTKSGGTNFLQSSAQTVLEVPGAPYKYNPDCQFFPSIEEVKTFRRKTLKTLSLE